ncbi:hypothetical protein G6M12_24390 [Agrobacterium tumefaciens]|nr:hypothetical protein [Agrobacterium tumefaciens]
MYRITSTAARLFFRLVMIVSLAGYSFSAVNAAMHPAATTVAVAQPQDDHSSHHMEQTAEVVHGGDHEGAQEHAGKANSKNCCQDFCGVAAITCSGSLVDRPRVVSLHGFVDDTDATGQSPSLNRPPNI